MNIRQEKILEYIDNKDKVSIHELIELFEMSEQTIRNDLRYLEENGCITRIHGGAVKKHKLDETPVLRRISENSKIKYDVGAVAINLIEEDDVIFFDAGTSILAIIEQIPSNRHFIAFTQALHIAHALTQFPNVEIHMIGGMLNSKLQELVGPKAIKDARELKLNKFFLSMSSFDNDGIYENHELSAQLKTTLIQQSRTVIAIADSSKEDAFGLIKIAELNDIDTFIVDRINSENMNQKLRENNVAVIECFRL